MYLSLDFTISFLPMKMKFEITSFQRNLICTKLYSMLAKILKTALDQPIVNYHWLFGLRNMLCLKFQSINLVSIPYLAKLFQTWCLLSLYSCMRHTSDFIGVLWVHINHLKNAVTHLFKIVCFRKKSIFQIKYCTSLKTKRLLNCQISKF